MDLLRNIFAAIFYILFFCWGFLKIRNIILIKKLNYKEKYEEIKREVKEDKLYKILVRILIVITSIIAIYLVLGVIFAIFAALMSIFTLGGAAFVDTGADSTFFDWYMQFVGSYLFLFKYIFYIVYVIVYMILTKGICKNWLIYKILQSNKN